MVIWVSIPAAWQPRLHHVAQRTPQQDCSPSGSAWIIACAGKSSHSDSDSLVAAVPASAADSLLDALDSWMRAQTVEAVLPKVEAKALLLSLREDRRFWAQQRKQFSVVWITFEKSLRDEKRPLSELLGSETSKRLLTAVEEMEDDPALVNTVLRSEIVEQLLGKILYEGILEFVERSDPLGNFLGQLPLLGLVRQAALQTARKQLDSLLGDKLSSFLGEYTASAVESATTFLLSPETADVRRSARRSAAAKLLAKPVRELVQLNEVEMVLVRDAVWAAVQEFRLPDETDLLDRLYDEFGRQPFSILLPSKAAISRGDAPLFERGRSVLGTIISSFFASSEWQSWAGGAGATTPNAPTSRPTTDATAVNVIAHTASSPSKAAGASEVGPGPAVWD